MSSFQNPSDPSPGEPLSSTLLGDMGVSFQTGQEHGYMGTNEPVPAGWYQALITHTEFKATKDNTGKRLNLTWEIADGAHKGRKIFTGLNLINKNAKAEEISRKELNTICAAMGFPQGHELRDSNELCGGSPIWINIKVVPATAEYAAKNETAGYHPWTLPDPVTGGPIRKAAPAPSTPAPGPGPARTGGAPAQAPAASTGRVTPPAQTTGRTPQTDSSRAPVTGNVSNTGEALPW